MTSLLQLIRKPARIIRRRLAQKRRARNGMQAVDQAIAAGLPSQLRLGLESAIGDRIPDDAQSIFAKVESIRQRIAARGEEQIPVYYSPKPAEGEEVTEPGDCKTFSARHLAEGTSAPGDVGRMIHLIARERNAKTIMEFGSCVGVGASYLASVPNCKRFITMEASQELAKIATESVHTVKPDGEVYNEFFNDALDHLLPTLTDGIDFAWIDGHHEKTATIHYYERILPHLNPGAIVAFDDIYWSQDMLDAWDYLRNLDGFSHSVDVGVCGLCIWDGSTTGPRQWSLKEYTRTGNWKPLKPAGWSESDA